MDEKLSAREIDFYAAELGAEALSRFQEILKTTERRRQVAALTGIPAPTLKDYFSGRTSPTVERFLMIALASGLPPSSFFASVERTLFSPGESPNPADSETPETVSVPILDVQAAAGAGRTVDVVKAEAEFAFPTYFLERLMGEDAGRSRLSSLRARGDSMEPTILDGALLIIDEAQRELPKRPSSAKMRRQEPAIYVFFTSDGLRLKRLRALDDGLIGIFSDNFHEHPPELFRPGPDGKLSIIGKVIWWDNRL